MISILDLTRQNQQLQPALDEAVCRVIASGQYILGPTVQQFEQAMGQWLNPQQPPHVVGCANGSDALFLALKALNIGPGDEVITTPFTYIATSESIIRAGATPVFIDVEPDSYNMDPTQLADALTPRTKAIMPVHLFGRPANMTAIMAFARHHGLKVIEDCAQAIGAVYEGTPVGLLGDIGCFSFFPSKNLGAFGDGGMCVTPYTHLAETLQMLRVHGSRQRYYHELSGINSRLDAMQAAILQVKLPHLKGYNQQRQQVAQRYHQGLAALSSVLMPPFPTVSAGCSQVFHQYTVTLAKDFTAETRDAVVAHMAAQGQVQTMIYYPVPAYRQPSHAFLGLAPQRFAVCEQLTQRVFSLPMFPEITEAEQNTVLQALKQALQACATPTKANALSH
jgi:dTDP-4-amino-4,6-dideoxygalactose transaminase